MSDGAGRPLLDPEALSRLSGLELVARGVVDGVLSGLHASPHHGSSVEFAEHKEYSPGDELRLIDWKLYGKTDRLYVKRFENETNLRATIALDATRSMAYAGSGPGKWEHARVLAASLAWLLLEQRDAVGLTLLDPEPRRFVPPRADRGHLQALLHLLAAATPSGSGPVAPALAALAERLAPRGLVVVIGDALEPVAPLLRALRLLGSRRHDVLLLRVLDRDEIDFPFEGLTRFRSLEDGREVLAEPGTARRHYLAAFGAHARELERGARGDGVDFHVVPTSTSPERALLGVLAARARAALPA